MLNMQNHLSQHVTQATINQHNQCCKCNPLLMNDDMRNRNKFVDANFNTLYVRRVFCLQKTRWCRSKNKVDVLHIRITAYSVTDVYSFVQKKHNIGLYFYNFIMWNPHYSYNKNAN